MDRYEKLPMYLKSKWKADIPLHVCQRLNYLWKASHLMLTDSVETSRNLSQSFKKIVAEYGIDLPESIERNICKYCSVILIPSKTCKIQVHERNKNSRKKKSRDGKTCRDKKEFVVLCTMCNRVTLKEMGSKIVKRKVNIKVMGASLPSSHPVDNQGSNGSKNPVKGFSFLDDQVKRRQSAPGRMSALKPLGISSDFIPIRTPFNPNLLFSKKRPSDDGSNETVDLIALERENKKKRRKTIQGGSKIVASVNAPTPSLSGLKTLLSAPKLSKK